MPLRWQEVALPLILIVTLIFLKYVPIRINGKATSCQRNGTIALQLFLGAPVTRTAFQWR